MNNRPLVPRGHVQGVWSGRLHIVCYYGLYCVKQLMYTTVGAHPHENLQILSDSYQMVYVLLACFFFCRGVYGICHGGLTSFTAPPPLAKIFSLGTHQHLRRFSVLLVRFHILL